MGKPDETRIRISSGEFRGRKIDCPQTGGVRPMLNKTRMALFNILQNKLKDAVVWDCFAGTGLLGIEAISRGAAHCTFVEKDGFHARVVINNVAELGITDRANVIRGSVFDLVKPEVPKLPNTPADVILLDPPHAMAKADGDSPFWPWLRALQTGPLVGENTVACFGHPAKQRFPDDLGKWKINQTREYGTVAFTILNPGLNTE